MGPTADQGTRLLELAGAHAKEVLADTQQIVDLAKARVAAIPTAPELVRTVDALCRLTAELVIRVQILEQDLAERDRAKRKQGRRRLGDR